MDTGAERGGGGAGAPQSPPHTVHDDDDYDHNNDGLLPLWQCHISAASCEPYFSTRSQKHKPRCSVEDELTRQF